MKKQLLFIVIMLLTATSAFAVEAEIGGLWYNLVLETKEAKVIKYKNDVGYSGNIVIPETVEYDGANYSVTNIGGGSKYYDGAFYNCSDLTSVTIPNSVTRIGDYAFSGCIGLTSISIPNNVTSIGRTAFSECRGLSSVTIGSGVKSIGAYAFYDCSGLTSVYISDIAAWCKILFVDRSSNPLSYAHRLYLGEEEITDLVIPNSVTSIGNEVFCGCSGLTSVTMPNYVTSIGNDAFSGCSSLTSVTIPNSVTTIGQYAFADCNSLISVTIPNSVTTIGVCAFWDCSGLTSVTIGNGVTSIGEQVFFRCSSLTSVTIPNSVTYIGNEAFYGCSSLSSLTIPNSVTRIGWSAFSRCSSLLSITIPNSVAYIGKEAFSGCSSLTSVAIPPKMTSIEDNTFKNCSGLSSITFSSSVTSIGEGAFEGCNSISSVHISDLSAWCKIKYGSTTKPMFQSNHHLYLNGVEIEQLTIPSDITSLGNYMFYGCSYLTSINIPNSVTILGENTFARCFKAKTLILPHNLQIIKKAAFKDCNSLKAVTIPANVKVIYQEAFANCDALESVKAKPSTPPLLYDNSFSNYSIPLEVPKGCKEEYQTAQGWKNFTNISESEKGYYKLIYLVDNIEFKSYKIEEGDSITPEPAPTKEGYTFSGWSEIPETMPAHNVTVTGTFNINKYKLTYTVDGVEYKSYEVEYGAIITAEAEPTKEGYTFGGWSEIPETMPARDVTVTGTFSINKYKLIYTVNGVEYKSYEVEYRATITAEAEPTKEGYTFSGWSEIPETMPAKDVMVSGTFSINKYKLTYTIDGEEYKSYEVEFGATITPEAAPTKEGYTFGGWSEIPQTMPAHDVTVTGSFSINMYKLTYTVDGEEYKSSEVEYGATITAEAEPTKEGYTFSGWSEIPETMPAHDVTVIGTFCINSYKLTYMIDDKVYKETTYEYGATITPEPKPEGDYDTFEWKDLPETMPAHDVVVYASYTSGIIEVLMASQHNVRIYSPNGKKRNKLQKGLNIVILDDGTIKKVMMK